MHHSGPGRLARPYPVEDLHLLFFASLPGALRNGSTIAQLGPTAEWLNRSKLAVCRGLKKRQNFARNGRRESRTFHRAWGYRPITSARACTTLGGRARKTITGTRLEGVRRTRQMRNNAPVVELPGYSSASPRWTRSSFQRPATRSTISAST